MPQATQVSRPTAQIISFPRTMPAERPWFGDWLTEQVGGRWMVVKQRRPTWRGIDMSDRVQLLNRQFDAYERQYEAMYGPIYPEA